MVSITLSTATLANLQYNKNRDIKTIINTEITDKITKIKQTKNLGFT